MNTAVLVILSILLPPVAVYLKTKSGKDTVINVLLWFLLFGTAGSSTRSTWCSKSSARMDHEW